MPRRDALKGLKPGVLAYRPAAVSRAKRDRSWDRAQRANPETCQISLRGVPRVVNERLNEIAAATGWTVSRVAVRLLESGLKAYAEALAANRENGQDN